MSKYLKTENGFQTTADVFESNGVGRKTSDGGEIFNDYSSNVAGRHSHAEGEYTEAVGQSAHAEGGYTKASGVCAHAEGLYTQATSQSAHAEGLRTEATGSNSHAEGVHTQANGRDSHAEGRGTQATGAQSHAEGYDTQATGLYSHAEGSARDIDSKLYDKYIVTLSSDDGTEYTVESTTAYGIASHAEGSMTLAYGPITHAEGFKTAAIGEYSHAEGFNTDAHGLHAHSEGYSTHASGAQSHAEGGGAISSGGCSHAEGFMATASGMASHAEGCYTQATGEGAHAEGDSTVSEGHGAHAEGNHTSASGIASHAEGAHTVSEGRGAHAEGSSTRASGVYSHAEGFCTKSVGEASHAEGEYTIAVGRNSSVSGMFNITQAVLYSTKTTPTTPLSRAVSEYATVADNFIVDHESGILEFENLKSVLCSEILANPIAYVGKVMLNSNHNTDAYVIQSISVNTSNSNYVTIDVTYYEICEATHLSGTYANIVGNGTSEDNRSNAHTLDWFGNSWYAGDIRCGGTSYDDARVLMKSPTTGSVGQFVAIKEVDANGVPIDFEAIDTVTNDDIDAILGISST